MLIIYTKRNLLMITFIITVIIFSIINWMCNLTTTYIQQNKQLQSSQNNIAFIDTKSLWQIEIPKINLTAPIAEGIDANTLNNYVGHFPTTSNLEGNVGLAAHNRGFQKNYFEHLKELELGDIIIYNTESDSKSYKVSSINIIDETDWTYLEKTEDNRITLITCVENQSTKRRCVQAVEI